MPIRSALAAIAAVIAMLTGGGAIAETKTVSGTVTYLNRSALPPGAVLDVELVDVSLADAPSVRLSSMRYAMNRVPFPFELPYDPMLIDDRFSYAVQARISMGNKVLYRNTSVFPALTRGAGDTVEVIVDLMRAPAPAESSLNGSSWVATELAGRALVAEKRPGMMFGDGGRVSVDSGCNRFNGPVEIGNGTIVFSDKMAGTLMACPPPFDQMEKDVLAALREVSGFVMNGDNLALVNDAGVTVMRLMRAK